MGCSIPENGSATVISTILDVLILVPMEIVPAFHMATTLLLSVKPLTS